MGYYEVMQVCLNGHQITASYNSSPQRRQDYCQKCGQKTIYQCPKCKEPIQGKYIVEGVLDLTKTPVPSNCHKCGNPYPWREKVIIDNPSSRRTKNGEYVYVNLDRINELKKIKNQDFDLTRLIKFCEELNLNFRDQSFLSVAMLVRSILDHAPSIFKLNSFTKVASNYGSRSFKESMQILDKSSRKIADSFLHTQIRKKESLPTSNQVDFSNNLDVLLAEISRLLK